MPVNCVDNFYCAGAQYRVINAIRRKLSFDFFFRRACPVSQGITALNDEPVNNAMER